MSESVLKVIKKAESALEQKVLLQGTVLNKTWCPNG